MNARFVDWIWHIRGSLPLVPGQSRGDAVRRLDPLFRQPGTTHQWTDGTLTFRKKDQAAQDRMSIFDGGMLRIDDGAAGSVLHYNLTSRALLFCFLAPLLFLAFAQGTILIGKLEGPAKEAAAGKADDKKTVLTQNPIDKALGAPAPEKPDAKDKSKDDGKSSPTAAYVFAGLFAALYVIGRLLEGRLVRSLFRKSLLGDDPVAVGGS